MEAAWMSALIAILSFHSVPYYQACGEEDGLLVIASGGFLDVHPFSPISEGYDRYRYLEMTLHVANAYGATAIQGSVAHPYGEGPFEVEILAPDIVENASISTFADCINLSVGLSSILTSELTHLLSVKPIMESGTRAGRPGFCEYACETYPYPLNWNYVNVVGDSRMHTRIIAKTDPVTQESDHFWRIDVLTSGFASEVTSVRLCAMNDVPFAFLREFTSTFPNHFHRSAGVEETMGASLGLEIRLEDGSCFRYRVLDYRFGTIHLQPRSDVAEWECYPVE